MKTILMNINEKEELLCIAKVSKKNNPCKSQLNPFIESIETNNLPLAWQILLGNIDWLNLYDIQYPDNIEKLAKNTAITYYDNGNISCKYKTKKFKRHGQYERWYYSGKLFIKCSYKNGKLHGSYKQWYDNGKINVICTYKDGNLNGRYEMWFNNGRLLERCNFKNYKLHGLHEKWDENGKLIEKCEYI